MGKENNNSNKTVLVIILIIAVVFTLGIFSLLIGGCFAKKFFEQKMGVKVDKERKSISIENKKTGEKYTFSEEEKLPENFPKEIPIYPGAQIVNSVSRMGFSDSESGENYSGSNVTWDTEDSIQKVESFYKNKLEQNGWDVNKGMSGYDDGEAMVMYNATKGDLSAILTIRSDKISKTSISIMSGRSK